MLVFFPLAIFIKIENLGTSLIDYLQVLLYVNTPKSEFYHINIEFSEFGVTEKPHVLPGVLQNASQQKFK